MLVKAITALFKYKIVSSIIVLACWPTNDRIKFAKQLIKQEISVTFSCDFSALEHIRRHGFQGVLSFQTENISFAKVKAHHFSHWYKWVIVGNNSSHMSEIPRYDADMVLVTADNLKGNKNETDAWSFNNQIILKDIHVHPRDGTTTHPWATWSNELGLQVAYEKERILRRLNLKEYPLKIAAPMGSYSEDTYVGTFKDFVVDISTPERDPGIRIAYGTSALIVEALNATEILISTQLWSTEVNNSSMIFMLSHGSADLAGGALRILHNRITRLDYATYMWPFRVGFTYLAERESSRNMFIEPFTTAVWCSCLATAVVLALAQRLMANKPVEKEGAYIAVLATYLQQDASAVPEGISGRMTFIVLSVSSMLFHAYYTSAIVSALMSTGRSGPDTLTSLADSRYAISSEDYDYMRYLMFDVETNREDLEYLKKKKKKASFYQDIERGLQLIQDGNTAYHTEYNQLYPRMKVFTDDQLCKLQYVDTIPETMSWMTTTKRGQWTDILKSKGTWLHETGLAKRLLSRLRIQPPPCRAALLAERVKIGDVGPVILISLLGAVLAFVQMGIEILVSRRTKQKSGADGIEEEMPIEDYIDEEIAID